MESNPDYPCTETFEASLRGEEINLLYSFMLKRISCDLSTSELSFLMGYPNDLIRKKEELKLKGSNLNELSKLAQVTDGTYRGVFLSSIGLQTTRCRLLRTTKEKTIEYALHLVGSDNSIKEHFRLLEMNRTYTAKAYSSSEQTAARETLGILTILYEGNFFLTARKPFTIYQRCASVSSIRHLNVEHVQRALHQLSGRKSHPRLKRIRSKEQGCMYIKDFGKTL